MSLEDFWKIEKQLDQLKTIALSLDKIHRVRCLEVVRELKNLYEYLDSILFLYCLALDEKSKHKTQKVVEQFCELVMTQTNKKFPFYFENQSALYELDLVIEPVIQKLKICIFKEACKFLEEKERNVCNWSV